MHPQDKPYKQELIQMLSDYSSHYEEESRSKHIMLSFIQQSDALFGKENGAGHITASSWILSLDRAHVLLTFHTKLGDWVQPGGHTEHGESVLETAQREAMEETGLQNFEQVMPGIFDLDIHTVPQYRDTPAHIHYDVRFLFVADKSHPLVITPESRDLRWFELKSIPCHFQCSSLLRMTAKTIKESC